MFIDTHTHIFPEKIATRTVEILRERLPKPYNVSYSDGTLNGLLESMKKAGIDKSIVLPVVTKPSQFDSINAFALKINGKNGIISLGGIHPDNDNIEERLEYIKSIGLKGIKLHPDYQNTFIDDEKYIAVIKKCIELSLTVVIHSGVDLGYPDLVRCTPDRVLNLIKAVYKDKSPEKTDIVLAHIGANGMYKEVLEKLCSLPVAFDLSYSLLDIDKPLLLEIIKNHGAENILFASDSPWGDQKEFKEYFEALPLSKEEKDLISYKNAMRIFDL